MSDHAAEHLTSPERLAAERVVLARRVQRLTGELTTAATTRMDETLPWFGALPADERASVGTVAKAGITTFVDWFTDERADTEKVAGIFSAAPRELARVLTLQHTVELVRTTMDVVEESISKIAGDNKSRQAQLRESLLRYSREIAFVAAEVYAQAAETRGAWDARLQDLVLDGILSNESAELLSSRASAFGWDLSREVFVLAGPVPSRRTSVEMHIEQMRRSARGHQLEVIVGVHDDLMVVVVGITDVGLAQHEICKPLLPHFGAGTVVAGPLVATLTDAWQSSRAALSGYRALGFTGAQARLATSDSLVAARVLSGDTAAIDAVATSIRTKLRQDVRVTLATYLENAPTIEACARELFVHVNTIRYRLRGVLEVTGLDPFDPKDALILRLGVMYERQMP
jgi:PucR C-terminal helix-turn-helix domain/GGDEF-like domain